MWETLAKVPVRNADDNGFRIYCYVDPEQENGDVTFELCVGNPTDQIFFEHFEEKLQSNGYIWAHSRGFFEAWQEFKSSARVMRESIFSYGESSLVAELGIEVDDHNSRAMRLNPILD